VNRAEAARELGVPPRAAPSDVERAFRREARTRHPDVGGDPRRFHRAIEARAVLLAPVQEEPFDRAVRLVVRYHPVIRLVEVLVRVADRRPVR
jgi:curved DNA-binding protein CbpA